MQCFKLIQNRSRLTALNLFKTAQHVTFRIFFTLCSTYFPRFELIPIFNSSQIGEPNHCMLLQSCPAKEEKSAALDSFQQLEIQAITF